MMLKFKFYRNFIPLFCILLLCVLSSCGKQNDNKEELASLTSTVSTLDEADVSDETIATADEAYVRQTTNQVVDSAVNWQGLYYERLCSLDEKDHKSCALIYVNNDDIPEMYVSGDTDAAQNLFFNISPNGTSAHSTYQTRNHNTIAYLERENKILETDSKSFDSSAALYWFNGAYVEEYNFYNSEEDCEYFCWNGYTNGQYCWGNRAFEKVADYLEEMKKDFDYTKARFPKTINIQDMKAKLKKEMKPIDNAESVNVSENLLFKSAEDFVGIYKEMTTEKYVKSNDSYETITYRIPEIYIQSEYVDSINQSIQDNYLSYFEKMQNGNEENDDDCPRFLDYDAYYDNGILSVIVHCGRPIVSLGSEIDHDYIYQINVENGSFVNSSSFLKTYALDKIETEKQVKKAITQYYESFSNSKWNDLCQRTLDHFQIEDEWSIGRSVSNKQHIPHAQMYFDNDKKLHVMYTDYNIAGPESMSKIIVV